MKTAKQTKKPTAKTTPTAPKKTLLISRSELPNYALDANYIGFPIDQFEQTLNVIIASLVRAASSTTTLTETGFHMGQATEKTRELYRAIAKAKSTFRPNPKDNPLGVVLIRDMAPIV